MQSASSIGTFPLCAGVLASAPGGLYRQRQGRRRDLSSHHSSSRWMANNATADRRHPATKDTATCAQSGTHELAQLNVRTQPAPLCVDTSIYEGRRRCEVTKDGGRTPLIS